MNYPNAPDIERSILGSVIYNMETRKELLPKLDVNDFYYKPNSVIFKHILGLKSQYGSFDITSLIQSIKTANEIAEVGGIQYLMDLTEGISITSDINTYIRMLKDLHQKRNILDYALKVQESVNNNLSSEELVSDVVDGLRKSIIDNDNDIILSPSKIYKIGVDSYSEFVNRKRLQTGFRELDNLIFIMYKEVSSIVGRPGASKSAFKTNIINNLCNSQYGIISVSTEQTKEVELVRHASLITKIPVTKFLRLKPDDDDYNEIIGKYNEAIKYISEKWNYHIISSRNITVSQMRQYCSQIMLKYSKDLIIIDLFDKLADVNTSEHKADNVSVKLGEINKIAEELNVHICVLAQIHRQVEQQRDRRPTMANIKGSGAYEEICRVVMGLYRERVYNPDVLDDIAECIILKQNNGPFGPDVKVNFAFDQETLEMIPIN